MQYSLISGDNHIDLTYCPPDLWSSQAPAKWKLIVPRVEQLDDGCHWFVEGQDKGVWNGIGPGFSKYQQGMFAHIDVGKHPLLVFRKSWPYAIPHALVLPLHEPVEAIIQLFHTGYKQLPLRWGLRRPQIGRTVGQVNMIVS